MTNKEIQLLLIQQKLLDPPADGKWGPQSAAALRAFQIKHGLAPSGTLDETTKTLLQTVKPAQLRLFDDLASKIIRYMLTQNYWIAIGPKAYNIVYLEGCDSDGKLNPDRFNEWNDRRMLIEILDETPKIIGNWLATTEPGATYTYSPMNPDGVFRIAFGQYRAWQFGLHGRTQYPALVQCGPVSGFRDKNMDGLRTGDPFVTGDYFGINQHHGWDMAFIDAASAGCLVGQSIEGHQDFMELLRGDRRYQVSKAYTFYTAVIPAEKL